MQVFLSHTRQDDDLAEKLAKNLETEGLNVWYDRHEIFPGDNWAAKVAQALEDSDAMVILISASALQSNSVKNEIEYALGKKGYKGRIIPVVIGDRNLLDAPEFPWILKKFNVIQFNKNNEEGLKQVANALRLVA